jgi:hypothetical protein
VTAVATHTCIVDEDIQTALVGLYLLEGILDRLVTGEIELHSFDSVARLWAILLEGLDSRLGLLQRAATHQDVIWLAGLQKGLDCLVPNTAVAASEVVREGGNPSILKSTNPLQKRRLEMSFCLSFFPAIQLLGSLSGE